MLVTLWDDPIKSWSNSITDCAVMCQIIQWRSSNDRPTTTCSWSRILHYCIYSCSMSSASSYAIFLSVAVGWGLLQRSHSETLMKHFWCCQEFFYQVTLVAMELNRLLVSKPYYAPISTHELKVILICVLFVNSKIIQITLAWIIIYIGTSADFQCFKHELK